MLTLDLRTASRESKRERERFDRVRRADRHYAVQLRKIAKTVGDIINAFPTGDLESYRKIKKALDEYAALIRPWAVQASASMLADIQRRDMKAWTDITQGMGEAMRLEIREAPTGDVMRQLMAEQVQLITSLPLEAAQRVHKLTLEGLADSTRASEIAKEIMRSGEVTKSRANLIARTEVGRAAANLTAARADFVGSDGYIWRTAGDSDVRERHRKLAGKFFKWNEPPVTGEKGERSLPGAIYNCRCYPQVILPERYRSANR